MNSANIRSVAADSNVLLSAVAGKAARRVFESDLIVVTTEANIAEVLEYVPEFAARYELHEEMLLETLDLLPVTVYAEPEYADQLATARELIGRRNEDDVALAALAVTLAIPIWSNDRDYECFPTGVFTTALLLKVLDA